MKQTGPGSASSSLGEARHGEPTDAGPASGGRYELREQIARGGMGSICVAYDRLAQQEVAYKQLAVTLETQRPRMTALFQREYDTLARLEHPNIVRAHEYGFDALGPYYTMELLTGVDLAKLAPLPYRDACRVIRDIASALALIHTRKWLHRDVSPNNVRMTSDGRAKLIDFGALTSFGMPSEIVGTPAFIAPECLTGEPLDERADLYSLGALLYWLLTRAVPVHARALEQLPAAYALPIVPASQHVAELPPELDELLLRLLQHDRLARPSSAAEVMERLTSIAALDPEQNEREVAFSYLLHPPLAGRSAAAQQTLETVDRLMAGRGQVVLVESPAGGGRSSALEQFAIQAQLRGATVLRADGRLNTGPLGVVQALLETGLLIHTEVAQRYRGRDSALLDTQQAHSTVQMAERHARRAAAAEEALLSMALRAPLVLLIDDAQQADPQSLALLASMRGAVQQHALLVVLARLSGAADSDAEALLRSGSQRLTLGPLAEAEVRQLVDALFGSVPNALMLGRWLHDESGGNPGQCANLLRALIASGDIRYAGGKFTLPLELEQGLGGREDKLLRNRVSTLGASAQQLVSLLSLQTAGLRLEQLASAAQLDTRETLLALEELQAQGLLTGGSERLALASAALRVAVSASLPAAQKRAAHLSLSRVLLAVHAPTLMQTYAAGQQLMRAGGRAELQGAKLIADATRGHTYEAAMSGEAIPYLESALEVLGRHGHSDQDHAHLLIPLSVAGFYGDLATQRRYLDRAMAVLSVASGLHVARRIRRFVGARLSLILGILYALLRGIVRPSRSNERSVRQNIESMMNVAAAGTAAAASALDAPEAERITAWLDPFAASSLASIQVGRDFCLATAAVAADRLHESIGHYRSVLERVARPIKGLDERVREQLRLGCLNGYGQASVDLDPAFALEAARELERGSLFMAPHAEVLRMGYHAYRGDLEASDRHRARAETLALRGGISWSALTILTHHALHGSILSDNVIGVMRAQSDLERLSVLSTSMARFHDIAQACLLRLRGHGADALPLWELVLSGRHHEQHQYYLMSCAWYARALRESGEPTRAQAQCERGLRELDDWRRGRVPAIRVLSQQLALAEAELGQLERAAERLDQQLAVSQDNPLTRGLLHRDRAEVALRAKDRAAFELHFADMESLFRATHNPWLIQQCDALLTRAVRSGLNPPMAPQHRAAIEASSEDLDGSTELAELPIRHEESA